MIDIPTDIANCTRSRRICKFVIVHARTIRARGDDHIVSSALEKLQRRLLQTAFRQADAEDVFRG